jgi:hypothetical protein
LAAGAVRELERRLPLDPDGRVLVDVHRGTVEVTGTDGTEVELRVRIESDATFNDPQKMVDDVEIVIDASPSSVRLKADYSKINRVGFNFDSTPKVHWRIKMPRAAMLRVKAHRSESRVQGMTGEVDIDAHRGDVTAQDLGGGLLLRLHRCEADVTFRKLGGRSRIETHRGEARVTLPGAQGFTLSTEFDKRSDFHSDFAIPVRTSGGQANFHGQVNGGGPTLSVTAHRGAIRLRRE